MNFHLILKSYRNDWKRILRNPVALIVVAGLCVLPSLYAWINIQACWNIYDNTSDIPVAVVNSDKGAAYHGKSLNVGSDVVEKLKKNNKIKWIFTTARDADLGLADSTYYAEIQIPEDFSSKFLTVLSGNPQKPQIIYKVDTKVNPVAGKITESAKNTLVQQIRDNFLQTMNATLFSSLNSVGKDADANRDAILQFKDAVIKINSSMNGINDSLNSVQTGSQDLSQLLGSLNEAMPTIQSGLSALSKGNSGTQAAIRNTQASVNQSLKNVSLNLSYLQASNARVHDLFGDLNSAASQKNAARVNAVLPGLNAELDSMNNAVDSTIDYLTACESLDMNSDIDGVISDLKNLKQSLSAMKKELLDLQMQMRTASPKVDQLYSALNAALPRIEQDLDDLDASLSRTISELQNLNAVLNNPSIAALITALQDLQSSPIRQDVKDLVKAAANSQADADAAMKQTDAAITQTAAMIDKSVSEIDTAVGFLKTVEDTNDDNRGRLGDVVSSLQKIKPYLTDEKTQFSNIQQSLNQTNTISQGIADTVNNDCEKISTQITSAVTKYNSGAEADISEMAQYLLAASKDAASLIQTAQNLGTQITDMIKTAQQGTALATSDAGALNKSLAEFRDVISLLSSKLELTDNSDIAQIIAVLQSNPELMGSYLSAPFELADESIYSIPNYGSSMTPIFTTLALWVGCLVLNSILKTKISGFSGSERMTLREQHFAKLLLFINLAMIQGLIAALGNIFILHVYVVNSFLFLILCVFSSFVFSVITFTLMSTMGNAGKALAIIYMILQLAGSGGTYPIQVDPPVFRALQPLLPFTYTVEGLREAIAGPLVSAVTLDFAALSLFCIVFLLFGYFSINRLHRLIYPFEEKFEASEIGE